MTLLEKAGDRLPGDTLSALNLASVLTTVAEVFVVLPVLLPPPPQLIRVVVLNAPSSIALRRAGRRGDPEEGDVIAILLMGYWTIQTPAKRRSAGASGRMLLHSSS